MNRFKDKVALITGAGSGIGRATALLFASEGARVAVNDLSEKDGRMSVETITRNGGNSSFFRADVTKHDQVKDMVQKIVQEFGRVDILHNNVGGWQRESHDTVVDDTEQE